MGQDRTARGAGCDGNWRARETRGGPGAAAWWELGWMMRQELVCRRRGSTQSSRPPRRRPGGWQVGVLFSTGLDTVCNVSTEPVTR